MERGTALLCREISIVHPLSKKERGTGGEARGTLRFPFSTTSFGGAGGGGTRRFAAGPLRDYKTVSPAEPVPNLLPTPRILLPKSPKTTYNAGVTAKEAQFRILDAQFRYGITARGAMPDATAPEIAFAGRSNVGKSSLLNVLVSRHSLVRTSSTPGCTRQINVFDVKVADGFSVSLVDLPGFGYAKRSKTERAQWGELIEEYLTTRAALCLVVIVVDVRRGLEEEELMLIDFLKEARKPELSPVRVLCAATKIDKVALAASRASVKSLAAQTHCPVLAFSAKSAEGRTDLWRAIRRSLPSEPPVPEPPPAT